MKSRFLFATIPWALAVALTAQDARPQFEVASIKPSPGGPGSMFGSKGPGMFNTENTPVRMLIAQAYGVKDFQISGGPAWIKSDGYTITAKTLAEGTPKERYEKMLLMLQVLLEDRFQVRLHRETKEMPVYTLTAAKAGLKLPPPNCVEFDEKNRPAPPAPGQPPVRFCNNIRGSRNGPNSVFDAYGISTTSLIGFLSNVTGRTIIDKTGFTGIFDAKFEYAPPAPQSSPDGATTAENNAPSLFTALQEQLGLKLESDRGAVEVLILDRVERPTEN